MSQRVYVAGSAGRWDERRNTSAVRPPRAGAAGEALRAIAAWRRYAPEHAEWVAAGAPTMTDAEHVARFGAPYERRKR